MKFSKLYYNESFTPGDVVAIVNDKKQYVIVDILDDGNYKIAELDNKSKTKIITKKDIIGIQRDLFGAKASTEPPEKEPAIKRPQSKDFKVKQLDLLGEDNINIARQAQIDKIKHYRDTDEFYSVCHARTGEAIKEHPDSYVVLCGMDKDKIFHSFAVDKDGNNLIPGDKSYIDMDNPETCTIVHKGQTYTFPYVELIKASDVER